MLGRHDHAGLQFPRLVDRDFHQERAGPQIGRRRDLADAAHEFLPAERFRHDRQLLAQLQIADQLSGTPNATRTLETSINRNAFWAAATRSFRSTYFSAT